MDYLTVVGISRSEPYTDEWVNWYRMLGADRILLYDNNPEPTIVAATMPRPWLDVVHFPGEVKQIPAYNAAIDRLRNRTIWAFFLDLDEFVVLHDRETLPELLTSYEEHAGLCLHWQMFGSNGHIMPPQAPQVIAYTKKMEPMYEVNRHVKTCVRLAACEQHSNPHFAVYRDCKAVNELFQPITGAFGDTTITRAQINHYWTRSRSEWFQKLARGRATKPKGVDPRRPESFDNIAEQATVTDKSAFRHAKRLWPQLFSPKELTAY